MTLAATDIDSPGLSLFASAGDEPRRRRPADAILFVGAAILVLIAGIVATAPPLREADLVAALDRLLGWLHVVWVLCYNAYAVIVIGLIAAAAYARRRPLLRDLLAATIAPLVCGELLGWIVDGSWPPLRTALFDSGDATYPSLRVALGVSVFLVAAPDLTRPLRRFLSTVLGFGAVAAVVLGEALPSGALGGLALGLAAGAAVRIAFGSAAGFPSEARVNAGLRDLRLDGLRGLQRADRQPEGAAAYDALRDGVPVLVTVYGRDARDTRLLARLWRLLWYRDVGPQASYSRLQQVEHEALMLHVVAGEGVHAPTVVATGRAKTGDALIVTSALNAPSLREVDPAALSDTLLDDVWAVAATLGRAYVGHGRLNADSIHVVDGHAVLTNVGGARLAAPDAALRTDVAELLVSCALLVGEERAIGAARRGVGSAELVGAVPYLQRAALTPTLRDEVRRQHLDVDALRQQVADAEGVEAPEVAAVRRVSLGSVVIAGVTVLAVYALLSQLADIGLQTIIDSFANAEWVWIVVALLIGQLPLVTDALAMQAAVGAAVPLGPTIVLESAIKFINIGVPSVAGKLALTIRFLHHQGIARAVAVSQGALDTAAGLVTQVIVVLVTLPTVDVDIEPPEGSAAKLVYAGLVIGAIGVVALVIGLFIPAVRRWLAPYLRPVTENLRGFVSSPGRAVRLLLANIASQVLYALTLMASTRAFSTDLSLADALLVNTAASLLAGLVPIPGGIGVAEASLTAGLVIAGVPESVALSAALVHRMVTYYLPPIWGFFSLRWLTNHGYV